MRREEQHGLRRPPLPPSIPTKASFSVTSVVADGHAKVMTKCSKTTPRPKRAGAPRKRRDGSKIPAKPYWNGRFFFICPKTGRILHAVPMFHPENNALVLDELENVVGRYPFANCFIYDRACKILLDVQKRKAALWEVKTYTTDKFHGWRHKESCLANPFSSAKLMKRIEGLNTSVAEQTFSWFRGYARSTNEMKPQRHQFLVPLYAKIHNALLERGATSHLNPYSCQRAKRKTPYECDDLEDGTGMNVARRR